MKYTRAEKIAGVAYLVFIALIYAGCSVLLLSGIVLDAVAKSTPALLLHIFLEICLNCLCIFAIGLNWDVVQALRRPNAEKDFILPIEQVRPFFPENTSAEDMEQIILAALEAYTHGENQ